MRASGTQDLRDTGLVAGRRRRGRGPAREARRFFGNLPLVAGLVGIALIVAVALFGPQVAPYDPNAWQLVEFGANGKIAVPPIPPGVAHPLGTDTMGRDLLSRLLWGARLTLAATLLTVVARTLLGVAVGLAVGWRGGLADALATQATNALAGFPQLMLALLLVVLLKDRGFLGFVVALAVVGWGDLAQFIRSEIIRLRGSAYIEAAQALGATTAQILRRHILRSLAPQLAGLIALEAGAVLLLLAELGFIGFFISGGTFFVDDAGRPMLPVRDRAPEWGQMLAGARYYAFANQWIAIVPAVVVGLAVLACNLLGEGIRGAIDPFGPRRLAPQTLDALGRVSLAALLIGVTGFGVATLRSPDISFDEGLRRAREAATRVEPRAEVAAAVVKFQSDVHGLGRPAKLNYYFKVPGQRTMLYVGFPDADANALDVRRFYDDDGLMTETLQPLGGWRVGWREALASAERRGGTSFRNGSQRYTVQVILERQEGWPAPAWHVAYRKLPNDAPALDLPVDASTGSPDVAFPLYQLAAALAARRELGDQVTLVGTGATWWSAAVAAGQPDGGNRADPEVPVARTFFYVAGEGRRVAAVTYDMRTGLVPAGSGSPLPGLPDAPPRSAEPLEGAWDTSAIRELVEAAGGRAVHDGWEREGARQWTVAVSQYRQGGRPLAMATYTLPGRNEVIRFQADLASHQVERVR